MVVQLKKPVSTSYPPKEIVCISTALRPKCIEVLISGAIVAKCVRT